MNPHRLQLEGENGGGLVAMQHQVLIHQPDGETLQEEAELVLDEALGVLQHPLLCLLLYTGTREGVFKTEEKDLILISGSICLKSLKKTTCLGPAAVPGSQWPRRASVSHSV